MMMLASMFLPAVRMPAGDEAIGVVTEVPGLLAFWTFQEEGGEPRRSIAGVGDFPLVEQAGIIERIRPDDGAPFGPFAARLREGQWLLLPREQIGPLNIHGKTAQVTVAAWLKRGRKTLTPTRCEGIAGVWDEPRGKRQYFLFIDIHVNKNHPDKKIRDKVSGHVSDNGGATPGFPFCYDVAQSKSSVPRDEWVCIGFTYDGEEVRAYYNGVCEEHAGYNPYRFPNGIYDGGADGAGFKVGNTNELYGKEKGNWFDGVIGGVAVFDRALSAEEMRKLAEPTRTLTGK